MSKYPNWDVLFYRFLPEIFNLSLMKINDSKTTLIQIYVELLKNLFVAFPLLFLADPDNTLFGPCHQNRGIKRSWGYTWHARCLIWQNRHNYQIKVTIGLFNSTHLFDNAWKLNNEIDHEQLKMSKCEYSLLDIISVE